MAKQVVLIDDLTKEVIEPGLGGGTIKFSINEKRYSIDLGTKNTDAFYKALQKYVDAAEEEVDAPVSKKSGSSAKSGASAGGSGRPKEELQAIRDWWRGQGNEISDRGRVAQDIQDAFDEAHKS